MSAHYFGYLTGFAIAFAINAVIAMFNKRMWTRRAHKLAAHSNMALPDQVLGRVGRLLRGEFLFGQLLTVVIVPLLVAVSVDDLTHRNWATWTRPILVALPLYWAVLCFVLSLWPRWKASGGYRVTHLRRSPVREAFTAVEFTAVIIGAVLSVALGDWGLWYGAAPAVWWLAWAASLAAAFAAWRYAATSIMNRSASASDAIELGWDDLLRFRQVRAVTAGAAWGTAVYLYLIDCAMSSAFVQKTTAPGMVSYQLQWWPIVVLIVVAFLLARLFRQGRQLWRRAWLERDGDG